RFSLPPLASGLFAVALPFVDLLASRLPVPSAGCAPPPVAAASRFLPPLGAVALPLFAAGRPARLWAVLGAPPRSFPPAAGVVRGVSFAVWAPPAPGVRLLGA
ncbi:1,4-alpha-glucan branching enzyme, partial [Mycobacterium tuberculosis]